MADEYTAKIGEALRAARQKAGISQTKASSVTGIDQASISDYENGKSEPRLRSFVSLANAYGAKPGELLSALGVETSAGAKGYDAGDAINAAYLRQILTRLDGLEAEVEALKRKVG